MCREMPLGHHAFSLATVTAERMTFRGGQILVQPAKRIFRTDPGFDGITLEFRDFDTRDDAFAFAREFIVTLAARSASQGTVLDFSTERHDHSGTMEQWQIFPGINVRDVKGPAFNHMFAGLQHERHYPAHPATWLKDIMRGADVIADPDLELALRAYAIACMSDSTEMRLLNVFAGLEALAGIAPAEPELVARIEALQRKVRDDPNYTEDEKALLAIMDGKKQKGRKAAVEQLLKSADAPADLRAELNRAYKARGAYLHAAATGKHVEGITNVAESMLIKALTHRIRSAAA